MIQKQKNAKGAIEGAKNTQLHNTANKMNKKKEKEWKRGVWISLFGMNFLFPHFVSAKRFKDELPRKLCKENFLKAVE